MLVVSIEAYTALCVFIGFLGGIIFSSIFWATREPKVNLRRDTVTGEVFDINTGKVFGIYKAPGQ